MPLSPYKLTDKWTPHRTQKSFGLLRPYEGQNDCLHLALEPRQYRQLPLCKLKSKLTQHQIPKLFDQLLRLPEQNKYPR
jgi:hypothetical protein